MSDLPNPLHSWFNDGSAKVVLGDVIPVDTERELQALGCVSGFMSTSFELQQSLAFWLEEQGGSRRNASAYVRSMLAGLANTAMHTPIEGQSELLARHETKGGLNERVPASARAGLLQ